MRIFVDMDGVLCDIASAYVLAKAHHPQVKFPQSIPGIFRGMEPMPGVLDAIQHLNAHADVWILSAPSVRNPHCYIEKREWVEQWLGYAMAKRLILATDKSLLQGDCLIDDNLSGKGQDRFSGELIHYGSQQFSGWPQIIEYLSSRLSN